MAGSIQSLTMKNFKLPKDLKQYIFDYALPSTEHIDLFELCIINLQPELQNILTKWFEVQYDIEISSSSKKIDIGGLLGVFPISIIDNIIQFSSDFYNNDTEWKFKNFVPTLTIEEVKVKVREPDIGIGAPIRFLRRKYKSLIGESPLLSTDKFTMFKCPGITQLAFKKLIMEVKR